MCFWAGNNNDYVLFLPQFRVRNEKRILSQLNSHGAAMTQKLETITGIIKPFFYEILEPAALEELELFVERFFRGERINLPAW